MAKFNFVDKGEGDKLSNCHYKLVQLESDNF